MNQLSIFSKSMNRYEAEFTFWNTYVASGQSAGTLKFSKPVSVLFICINCSLNIDTEVWII